MGIFPDHYFVGGHIVHDGNIFVISKSFTMSKLLEATTRLIEKLQGSKLRLHLSTNPNLPAELNLNFDGPNPQYTKEQIESIYHCGKPVGFWWGVGTEWMEFCVDDYGTVRPYIYEVLVDESKLLRITNYEEFDKFSHEYLEIPEIFRRHPISSVSFCGTIGWKDMMKKYGGVEIAPYLYERRLHSRWYYTWDAASGCVWDKNCVEIRLFATFDEEKSEFVYA